MRKTAYLAFGSNLGNSEENVREAYASLSLVPGVYPAALSDLYRTKPWGYADQPDFINACCRVETTLSPAALLGVCLGIEAAMGRVRQFKNGPRVIDIDLLLYEGESRNTEELLLPHPGIPEREFVLEPLLDVCENGFACGLNVPETLRILREKNSAIPAEKDGPGAV